MMSVPTIRLLSPHSLAGVSSCGLRDDQDIPINA